MKRVLLIAVVLMFHSSFLSAQNDSRDGEFTFDKRRYTEAIKILEPIYQSNPLQKTAIDLADALFYTKKYEKALMYYESAIYLGQIPESAMKNYFSALYEYGDIDLAKKTAKDFYLKFGKKDLMYKLDSADALRSQDPIYFETNLASNTSNDEFGMLPMFDGFKLVNSAISFYSRETSQLNKKLLHPYAVKYVDPMSGIAKYNPIGVKTDKSYDVISCYDNEEGKVYITRTALGKDNILISKIFIADIAEDFTISNLVEFPYNSEDFSNGHPCVSKDGEILYFASDRPGGQGGADIYRCMKLENGTWGFPINVGNAVNTAGDELYPYITPQGNTLYFSSTGHSIFGGLDINKAQKTRSHAFKRVENMGVPFNSEKDDFGVVFNDNYGTEGFFSSNRKEGKGGDDVYYFSYQNNKVCKDPVKNFKMIVLDKKTRARVPNAHLKMTVKIDGRVFEDITDENGEVNLLVEGCNDFDVEATHDFYLNNLFYYDGFRKVVTIELDKKELNNIIGLESIYYEKSKFEVPTAAEPQLGRLAILLKKNPDVKVELSSHTDSRGEDAFNMDLSHKRAEQIVKFLVNSGVNKNQLVAQGYGESKIINECGNDVPCSEEMHEKNRRTEFKILEINKESF